MVADRTTSGDAPTGSAPADGAAIRTAGPAGVTGAYGAGSVAVIDDDALVRTAMVGLLRSLDLPSRAFASAHEYLRSPTEGVACIISDVQMPGMDGVQLLKALRGNGIVTPLIVMTAYPDEHVRDSAMAAGAAGYVEKPLDIDELIGCLELVLGSLR